MTCRVTDGLPFSQRPTNQIPRQPVYHWIFQLCSRITRAGRLVAGQSGFIFIAVFLRTYQSCLRRYLSFCHAYAWGPFPFSGVRAVTVLFRNVFGAGGRIPDENVDVSGSGSPRPDHEGFTGASGAVLLSSVAPGAEWSSEGAAKIWPFPARSSPYNPPASSPDPASNIGPIRNRQLWRGVILSRGNNMLFRLLSCGRDHRTHGVFV